jgi:hypothetical protein
MPQNVYYFLNFSMQESHVCKGAAKMCFYWALALNQLEVNVTNNVKIEGYVKSYWVQNNEQCTFDES